MVLSLVSLAGIKSRETPARNSLHLYCNKNVLRYQALLQNFQEKDYHNPPVFQGYPISLLNIESVSFYCLIS